MTETPESEQNPKPRRAFKTLAGLLVFFGLAGAGLWQLVVHPATPLPPEWNPTKPLVVTQPATWLTPGKLRKALRDPAACLAALPGTSDVASLDPLQASAQCHIRNRVEVSILGGTRLGPIETSCAIALRTAMWEHHVVQPAAAAHLNTSVSTIRQIGSYNCRAMRTPSGTNTRMSTHATAEAIDITGFELTDGRKVNLQDHWDSEEFSPFLHAVRDGACTWFATTLGPDFNALHADHFHLQSRGWGTCR